MAKKKPVSEPVRTEPLLCPYVKFSARVVHRRDIRNCPWNPRQIKDDARRRLKDNLKRVGLVNALVWNERTGNLVSGHQRLGVLDALMKTDDYLLPVDVVDLDEKTEKEQNVFLNNSDAQGEFDVQALEKLIRDGEVDIERSGLDVAACVQYFGEDVLTNQEPQALEAIAERLRQTAEAYDKIEADAKKKHDLGYYRVVVFKDTESAEKLAVAMSLPGQIFLPGDHLMSLLERDNDGR